MMRSYFLGVALAFCFEAANQNSVEAAPPLRQKPFWHTNYERAKELARQEDKPLFVVFR
jgi:hypothetical protein